MTPARLLLAAVLAIGSCGAAEAHTGARAFILLLPTELYMVGGALVVALSFVVMARGKAPQDRRSAGPVRA